ncbi:hypothetical protein DFH27DRAFT_648288 [Peziza echinospora]|nr:hypothetical protein DFH27DRAFT_648288 [Peziza echinospora]
MASTQPTSTVSPGCKHPFVGSMAKRQRYDYFKSFPTATVIDGPFTHPGLSTATQRWSPSGANPGRVVGVRFRTTHPRPTLPPQSYYRSGTPILLITTLTYDAYQGLQFYPPITAQVYVPPMPMPTGSTLYLETTYGTQSTLGALRRHIIRMLRLRPEDEDILQRHVTFYRHDEQEQFSATESQSLLNGAKELDTDSALDRAVCNLGEGLESADEMPTKAGEEEVGESSLVDCVSGDDGGCVFVQAVVTVHWQH